MSHTFFVKLSLGKVFNLSGSYYYMENPNDPFIIRKTFITTQEQFLNISGLHYQENPSDAIFLKLPLENRKSV